jgi:hypothetical protein
MSGSYESLLDWFMKNHPTEFYHQEEVIKRMNAILRGVPLQFLPDKETHISLSIVRNPETSRNEFSLNDVGQIFLGALSKAILDSLSGHLEGLLSAGVGDAFIKERIRQVLENPEPLRKCHLCGFNNMSTARYCQSCGRQLP